MWITVDVKTFSRGTCQCETTNGASLMTYEGPGTTTRSEVNARVNEGKGILAMPISQFWEQYKANWIERTWGCGWKEGNWRRRERRKKKRLRIVVRNTSRVTEWEMLMVLNLECAIRFTGHNKLVLLAKSSSALQFHTEHIFNNLPGCTRPPRVATSDSRSSSTSCTSKCWDAILVASLLVTFHLPPVSEAMTCTLTLHSQNLLPHRSIPTKVLGNNNSPVDTRNSFSKFWIARTRPWMPHCRNALSHDKCTLCWIVGSDFLHNIQAWAFWFTPFSIRRGQPFRIILKSASQLTLDLPSLETRHPVT